MKCFHMVTNLAGVIRYLGRPASQVDTLARLERETLVGNI